jgi:hypothetical protein
MLKRLAPLLAFLAVLMPPTPARPDCLTDLWGEVICGLGPCTSDRYGRVYCAQFRFGTAVRTLSGQVVCGRGRCVITLRGEVVCSTLDGGGVVTQIDGTVRCDGSCEAASPYLCQSRPAGH